MEHQSRLLQKTRVSVTLRDPKDLLLSFRVQPKDLIIESMCQRCPNQELFGGDSDHLNLKSSVEEERDTDIDRARVPNPEVRHGCREREKTLEPESVRGQTTRKVVRR